MTHLTIMYEKCDKYAGASDRPPPHRHPVYHIRAGARAEFARKSAGIPAERPDAHPVRSKHVRLAQSVLWQHPGARPLRGGRRRPAAGRPGGAELAENIKPFMTRESHENFLNGERYIENPAGVRRFLAALPMTDIPAATVVFKPLDAVDGANETPQAVIFFVSPDQLSALTVLANYARGDNENVIIPYAAGCQTIGIYPYREAASARPRAVVGLTDLSARLYVRKQLGDPHLLTFTVPFALFEEMERSVPGSFLERPTWLALRG